MARLNGSAASEATSIVATVAKTVIQLVAPANQILALTGYGFGGRGITNTEQPGLVEFMRQTTAGTASSLTARKKQPSRAETLQGAAQEDFTVEPTTTDKVRHHTIHPQTDLEIRDGFGNEMEVEGGGRLGMRATFADVQTVDNYIDFEE